MAGEDDVICPLAADVAHVSVNANQHVGTL